MSEPEHSATILVVDDEAKARLFLSSLLEQDGYRILQAADGISALRSAHLAKPDAILLDVMMPDLDGYAVCQQMRADPGLEFVPIILLTALDDRSSRLRGIEAGADDFISKPFDSIELRARLRTITRLNRFRRLSEDRARFESVISHAPDGIVVARGSGEILVANSSFLQLLGGRPAPARFVDLIPAERRRQWDRQMEQTYSPLGRIGPIETELDTGSPVRPTVEITACQIPWERETVFQFHVRNVTEKKQLEAQLLRSQRIEILGQLAGGIVHDVNNVLAAIMGSAQLIEIGEPQRARTHIQNITASSQRGAMMLRQLLMFARGSDGELKPIETGPVVYEVANVIKETFGRMFEVQAEIEPGLPAILADATQLHQIVMNLSVNARDAMPGGGRLTLCAARRLVSAEAAPALAADARPGDFVALSVRDSGTGIPPEVRARLFDPFFTTKPPGKGTGLGLATVLRLAKRHGGFVSLETEVGKGTCFTVHLPVASDAVGD